MIIKQAVYKKVRETRLREVEPEVHGCDFCKKEIKEVYSDTNRLEVTAFYQQFDEGDNSSRHHFCSWDCVLQWLPTCKSDHFVNLPFLHFDGEGNTVKQFMEAVENYTLQKALKELEAPVKKKPSKKKK